MVSKGRRGNARRVHSSWAKRSREAVPDSKGGINSGPVTSRVSLDDHQPLAIRLAGGPKRPHRGLHQKIADFLAGLNRIAQMPKPVDRLGSSDAIAKKRHRPKTGQIHIDELDSWLAFARFILI